MANWRVEVASGNSLADSRSEPFLQKSGSAAGRMRAVNQTLPFSSYIGLWTLAWLSHCGSAPQYGDGATIGSSLVLGVLGSRTGILTWVTVFLTGSRTGKLSVLSSGAP